MKTAGFITRFRAPMKGHKNGIPVLNLQNHHRDPRKIKAFKTLSRALKMRNQETTHDTVPYHQNQMHMETRDSKIIPFPVAMDPVVKLDFHPHKGVH
jgi:hypothetical protein